MTTAAILIAAIRIWGWIGAAVALVFLTIGMDRVDEDARGAYVFRPLLIPGVLVLWPLVLWRWWQLETEAVGWAERYRPVRQAHGWAALLMALAIVGVLLFGLSARQTWPDHIPPVQLSEGRSE